MIRTIGWVIYLMVAVAIALLPRYIKRRAHRSQWYPQAWWWFVSRRMHEIGYPNWPSVKFARKMGWMD